MAQLPVLKIKLPGQSISGIAQESYIHQFLSDVQVLCSDEGAVTLKKLESSSVHVVTDKGNCTCKNIKVKLWFEYYICREYTSYSKRKTNSAGNFSRTQPVEIAALKWAASSEFGTYRLCEQRRFRRACASAQSRQNLRYSLIQAVSQEEPSRQKARSLAPLNGWACAVKICHDWMLEDTNSLDAAQIWRIRRKLGHKVIKTSFESCCYRNYDKIWKISLHGDDPISLPVPSTKPINYHACKNSCRPSLSKVRSAGNVDGIVTVIARSKAVILDQKPLNTVPAQSTAQVGILVLPLWSAGHNFHPSCSSRSWQRKVKSATSWENQFMPCANNNGADQPVHPRSLISAFVGHCPDSTCIILILAKSKLSRL